VIDVVNVVVNVVVAIGVRNAVRRVVGIHRPTVGATVTHEETSTVVGAVRICIETAARNTASGTRIEFVGWWEPFRILPMVVLLLFVERGCGGGVGGGGGHDIKNEPNMSRPPEERASEYSVNSRRD
jgi:hypothetical protein